MSSGKAFKISDKVYWVGAVDWKIRNFHGYSTDAGTTYNAYLIMADKITLIDTVKAPFYSEMMSRISSIVEPSKIDYIISNHSEMDHSGALPQAIAEIRPEKVFASANGAKALAAHFGNIGAIQTVKTGDKLNIGNLELSFLETRMLHWPDSMFSYLHGEDILFSQDGFGMHLATMRLFDDQNDLHELEFQASTYYANILLPYSELVLKCLETFKSLGLKVKLIAPDHGPIWRSNIENIIAWYEKWARQERDLRAIVVYDTMWGSTATMAKSISEGLAQSGIPVKVIPITESHRSFIATEAMNAGIIFFGSPTINNNMFPSVADVLYYLKGLKPKNKIGGVFGSYGWSGESVKQLAEFFNSMNIEMLSDPFSVKYVPTSADLDKCREIGFSAGKELFKRAYK